MAYYGKKILSLPCFNVSLRLHNRRESKKEMLAFHYTVASVCAEPFKNILRFSVLIFVHICMANIIN